MDSDRSFFNHFLVEIFNEILKIEEACLADGDFGNLSVREVHVIDTVCTAEDDGRSTKAADIAESLRITAGTLSISVSLLEKKGYLLRKKDNTDKRVVRIGCTPIGRKAHRIHNEFHAEMVDSVISALTDDEQAALTKALGSISDFFREKGKKNSGGDIN